MNSVSNECLPEMKIRVFLAVKQEFDNQQYEWHQTEISPSELELLKGLLNREMKSGRKKNNASIFVGNVNNMGCTMESAVEFYSALLKKLSEVSK